jgi:hypothetical protein
VRTVTTLRAKLGRAQDGAAGRIAARIRAEPVRTWAEQADIDDGVAPEVS